MVAEARSAQGEGEEEVLHPALAWGVALLFLGVRWGLTRTRARGLRMAGRGEVAAGMGREEVGVAVV